ncbi:dienelactone hydrolase endo-1,3,1,4-beta-D-glucanase [Coniophora puteana RWD-64-598 SS2]|uniref:Dienelactone hydrolase endo-1,3,1,4-beta-D-glucanase n=1 Tax=Coniophora puteana (strain RWD-64-598) TaxID=741705 RepID=A0A5M3MIZ5_CONPW|nr:dienelactone hydrolase endo-1,3,1,4-beta-D-glucanase [Coniophora puteana RWD-64-598 SS2]EIW79006.1 dienelactone hydrolase endo-1,3,1,4-beta-D-glucanase [Coniophora puteana RWD-64-598 SS2]
MSMCDRCVQGIRHEGTPEGKFEAINGVRCYVATPSNDFAADRVLIYVVDLFGVDLINGQLLADDFARNGFKVVMPDLFEGDNVPVDEMESGRYNLQPWLAKHGPAQALPYLYKAIAGLKDRGVTRLAAVGYCYGGRLAWDLAIDNVTQVTIVNHPSLLKNPEDLDKYVSLSKAPLLINSCEIDPVFGAEFQTKADETFVGKFEPGYKREYWPGCTHGFAVRGDLEDPNVKT